MLKDLKRIPIFVPFIMFGMLIYLLVIEVPQRLIGFWWCDRCHIRYNFRSEKFEDTACGYDGEYVIDVHCKDCEDKEREGK